MAVSGSGKGIQIVVGTDYNDRDLKRAQADLNRLKMQAAKTQGPMKQLGGTLRGALGPAFALAGAAAAGFALKLGVEAVQAAIEEEKSVARLKMALDNLALGFAMPVVDDFIDKTQRASGVADDQLRPALGSLAQATGNLYDAQNLLNLALDVSAGTGRDLSSVTTALARAANGQTTALRRLAPSIDGAVLKTGDLTKITGELTRLFGGQAEARANSYAGTIDRLSIAADELMEAFGKGFLDAFREGLGGSTEELMDTLQDLEPQMEQIGGTIGELAGTIGKMSGAIDLFGNLVNIAVVNNIGPWQMLADAIGMGADESMTLSEDAKLMADVLSGTVSSGIQQATDDMGKLAREAEETEQYFENLNSELKIFGDLTSKNDAVRGYQAALDDLRKSVKENGRAFNDTTEEGRANADALDDIFTSAQKVAEGQQTAAEKIRTMEQASADATDVLKKMGVPPDVRASLIQPFDTLIAKFRENNTLADNLKQRMEGLPTGTRTFTYDIVVNNANSLPPHMRAAGGPIGLGGRGSDTVPAMLTPGEFVVRKAAVQQFGRGFFSQLNRGINPLAGMTPTAGGSGGGLTINGGITVQSAPGERAETSLPRALRRAAFLAGVNG
jgi:methyl-accepting chemotaxis protein